MKNILEHSTFTTHGYYLPSYQECREICDAHDNFLFYETKHNVDGYDISIFNYRLAHFDQFENPIVEKDIKAYELRGLTFVWNKDGSLYKRFLLLDKFFNVEQTPCSAYSVLKTYKIKNIFNKEDGSIASFVRLPNGKAIGKSKASFESDQAIAIQKIYDEDERIKEYVDFCLSQDIIPIFEYVSPKNRIVLPYANTELILLRLRDNNTGEYIDVDDHKTHLDGITVAESYDDLGLDDLIELAKVEEDKEGWIVQFENGKMAKIKTGWYCDRHKLFTDELNRENIVIKMILDETIDDAIAQLNSDNRSNLAVNGEGDNVDEVVSGINHIINIVNFKMSQMMNDVEELVSNYDGDYKVEVEKEEINFYARKHFALKFKKDKYFALAMSIINGKKDILEVIKEYIGIKTKNLEMARKWLRIVENEYKLSKG